MYLLDYNNTFQQLLISCWRRVFTVSLDVHSFPFSCLPCSFINSLFACHNQCKLTFNIECVFLIIYLRNYESLFTHEDTFKYNKRGECIMQTSFVMFLAKQPNVVNMFQTQIVYIETSEPCIWGTLAVNNSSPNRLIFLKKKKKLN